MRILLKACTEFIRVKRSLTIICIFCLISPGILCLSSAHSKIYIDVSSPGVRKLPVSVNVQGPLPSGQIEQIIKHDLEATGLFSFVDPGIPGAEITADVTVKTAYELNATLSVNDLVEGSEVLKKRFSSSLKSTRKVAHSISNDIYEVTTGKKGIFTTKISFLVNTSPGTKDLRLMDWDGHNRFRIVSRGLTSSHTWSHDGRYMIYSTERKRKWRIYILDLKNFREMVLFSSRGLNIVGGTSPDDLIAFSSSKDGNSEIYTIDIYGKDLKKRTSSFGIDVSPVFSPDGKKIAFVSDRGGTPQIYLLNTNGRRPERVSFEGSYNTSPSWSPDGKQLVFTGRKDGKNQIFVVKSDGSDSRQLTHTGNNESPVFSPDGYFLAFDSDREGKRGIYIMRTNGEGPERITPSHLDAMSPEWSPYLK